MPLPIPKLFHKNYHKLVDEMVESISRHTDVWTNYNPSDPGVTILELLCWITETMLYRIDQIPQQSYVNFLRLVAGASGENIDFLLSEKDLDVEYRDLLIFLKEIEDRHIFVVPDKHQQHLDRTVLSGELRGFFEAEKSKLSPHAVIEIIEPSSNWIIDDVKRKYEIIREKNSLHVFRKGRKTTIEELKAVVLRFARSNYRAITEEDFGRLALEATRNTEGARIERAIANSFSDIGKVEVVIVANREDKYDELITIVQEFLDNRKLIGTRVEVKQAKFTNVDIEMDVICAFHAPKEVVERQIKERLYEYLDPITGGHNKKGWPYNRSLTIYEIAQIGEENSDVEGVYRTKLKDENGQEVIEARINGLVAKGVNIEVVAHYEEPENYTKQENMVENNSQRK